MLLAIDTSTRSMGIALYDGAQVLGLSAWNTANHHTVELAPAVDDLLKRCDVEAKKLTALGVAIGPGSFTGLRIGLGFAKGIALAHHLPIVGIPTLDIVAASQPVQPIPLIAALRAGRGRLAIDWYQAEDETWKSVAKPELLTAQDLAGKLDGECLICGEFNGAERQFLAEIPGVHLPSPAKSMRNPGLLAELAWNRVQSGKLDDPASLVPTYLHVGDPIPA